jgi:hypothetical protein
MKAKFLVAAVAALILAPVAMNAQAPAGATGKCKDGTYTTAPTKSGACRGHKGVDTWLAPVPAKSTTASATTPAAPASAPAAAPAPAAKPVSAPAPAASTAMTAKPAASKAAKTAAPGGGPGLVWVNTSSKVYHCYGGESYGTTKAGKYESEAAAKAEGAHAAHGKACSAN